MLQLRTSNASMYVPVATLLTTAVLCHPLSAPPLIVTWDAWGPLGTRAMVEFRRPFAVAGLHVFYHDGIKDFNQYDITANVYGPVVPHGRALRSGHNHSGAVHTKEADLSSRSALRAMAGTRLPYREMSLSIPGASAGSLCILEEEDGPKVSTADHQRA